MVSFATGATAPRAVPSTKRWPGASLLSELLEAGDRRPKEGGWQRGKFGT